MISPVIYCLFLYNIMCQSIKLQSTSISFVVVGDWGGLPVSPYYTEAQADVNISMNNVAEEINSNFVVALGDICGYVIGVFICAYV